MYVVSHDFGFAPNPFHRTCTLATCKPAIRSTAKLDDWIIGMGGRELDLIGHCLFAMRVTNTMTFDEYWTSPQYASKRPVRNGSRKLVVGDNIYHRCPASGAWQQADSVHSRADGTPEPSNVKRDTRTNRVLISSNYFYFGRLAPLVPTQIISAVGFFNRRTHWVFEEREGQPFIRWLNENFSHQLNLVSGAPVDFHRSSARYSADRGRII